MIISDVRLLMEIILKLKKVVRVFHSLELSETITHKIEKLVEFICDIIDCDRATIFLIDESTGELWSKVAKGTVTIRIPMGTGIVGSVVETQSNVRIDDAYQDSRFNQNVDLKTNYRTRTILCVPILDSHKHVIGNLSYF